MILLTLRGNEKDLGSFTVKRFLPSSKRKTVGSFIFFDHMGPASFAPGDGLNVRPHPHIGLSTITYLFEGELLHRDSLGTCQPIKPGDINMMTAGKGITHSERTPDALRQSGYRAEGLQLWMALPETHETCEPAFYHYSANELPTAQGNGWAAHVMIGKAWDATSPVKQYHCDVYAKIAMRKSAACVLPDNVEERAVYVLDGKVMLNDTEIESQALHIIHQDDATLRCASDEATIILIGGDPIGKRRIEWNFVATSQTLIDDAKARWQARQFPIIPDDHEEFIPLPIT